MILKIKKIHPSIPLPQYHSEGAAGFDLMSAENISAPVGKTILVKTGIACEIPPGYELQIRPRSGVAYKTGLIIKNSPGTIDSDYRGEIGILIYNTGERFGHYINFGDRIAQAVLCPVVRAEIEEVQELTPSKRGDGGYGSTDKQEVQKL